MNKYTYFDNYDAALAAAQRDTKITGKTLVILQVTSSGYYKLVQYKTYEAFRNAYMRYSFVTLVKPSITCTEYTLCVEDSNSTDTMECKILST